MALSGALDPNTTKVHWCNALQVLTYLKKSLEKVMDIIWPTSQSYFHLSFILIKMNFYSFLFFCDV